jgi:two-component system sensor histidine kinase KdpD
MPGRKDPNYPASLKKGESDERAEMQEGKEEEGASRPTFLDLIKTKGRGNLKVFLGFAAGVGKTYRMLQEAHALKTKGVDVVIGVVDTHGRKDTERLIEGLEQIPPRIVDYKGMKLEDLDMDAVLVRFPELVLIDELAHTNAPRGHNKKRWQDVEELLSMGINVMATMNVQHIASLNDDIARVTKIRVLETVPDKFITTLADEIVDVDLPVNELLDRLEEGKIYPKESVANALRNFFQSKKLTSLRELSLREAAKSVGAKAANKRSASAEGDFPRERILVAMTPGAVNASALLRKGARLAGELNTDWDAVSVISPDHPEETWTMDEMQVFNNNKDLAVHLGARLVILRGKEVAHMILDYARKNRIGKIVIGSPWQPWYRRWFQENTMEHILSEAGPIDVYIVSFERPRQREGWTD